MRQRTYRYFTGQPLWPFGHGRSYTTFRYSNLEVLLPAGSPGASSAPAPVVSVEVANTGPRTSEEVVLVFVSHADPGAPLRQLAAFRRVALEPGAAARVTLALAPEALTVVDDDGVRRPAREPTTISVGPLSQRLAPE